MKKQRTAEQIAKSEERKKRMREYAAQIGKLSDQERLAMARACLVKKLEGGEPFSNFNQCMIALQLPTATVLGGFRQWLTAGRAVRKGQSGLGIWVPIGPKRTDEATGEKSTDKQGFILGTVFDISQTQEIETHTLEVNEAIVEHSGNLTLV